MKKEIFIFLVNHIHKGIRNEKVKIIRSVNFSVFYFDSINISKNIQRIKQMHF